MTEIQIKVEARRNSIKLAFHAHSTKTEEQKWEIDCHKPFFINVYLFNNELNKTVTQKTFQLRIPSNFIVNLPRGKLWQLAAFLEDNRFALLWTDSYFIVNLFHGETPPTVSSISIY